MKVPIPLNSTLSTDSHPNDIKDPTRDRDLFNNNRSYLYNKYLTNARKQEIGKDSYITTTGKMLDIVQKGMQIYIYQNKRLILICNALGVENQKYFDVDDVVIYEGLIWTVTKTLNGYVIEQYSKDTMEFIESTDFEEADILDIRFIRNTNKIIIKYTNGIIKIDEETINDEDMARYMSEKSGEFIALESNGKIYFGYNNPIGIDTVPPQVIIDIELSGVITAWKLKDVFEELGLNQGTGYDININIAADTLIGSNVNSDYAMDFVTGIDNPLLHIINLTIGEGAIISGKGGNSGQVYNVGGDSPSISSQRVDNSQNGSTAIICASHLKISGTGRIQGGGGGGGSWIGIARYSTSQTGGNFGVFGRGGGGQGIPGGIGGVDGNKDAPGDGQNYKYYASSARAGEGGGVDPAEASWVNSGTAIASNRIQSYKLGAPGINGNAIQIYAPAIVSNDGVTLIGGIITT